MDKPTKERIEQEIKALEEIKPKVRRYSMFGDDNHAKINAQVDALLERWTEDDCYNRYPDDERDYDIRGCALSSVAWLEGEYEEDSLVDSWRPLAKG